MTEMEDREARAMFSIPPPTELGLARVRHFEVAQVGYIRLGLGEVGEQSEPGGGQPQQTRASRNTTRPPDPSRRRSQQLRTAAQGRLCSPFRGGMPTLDVRR